MRSMPWMSNNIVPKRLKPNGTDVEPMINRQTNKSLACTCRCGSDGCDPFDPFSIIRQNNQSVHAGSGCQWGLHRFFASVCSRRSPNVRRAVLYARRWSLAGSRQVAGHSRTSSGRGERTWPRVPCGAGRLRVAPPLPGHATVW